MVRGRVNKHTTTKPGDTYNPEAGASERIVGQRVNTLLRVTGIGKLISFYKFIYFNGPGFVKFSGIGLILMIGLTHMYVFPGHFETAKCISMSFAALFAETLLSALWILKGLRWGWILGSVLCAV